MSLTPYNPYATIAKPNEPLAYLYDGTAEGIFTCVYLAAKAKEAPCDLLQGKNLQLRFGQVERTIETDIDAALRVKRSIIRNYGSEVFRHLQCAASSDEPDAGITVFRFTMRLLKSCTACAQCPKKQTCMQACKAAHRENLLNDLADPLTHRMEALRRHTVNETEHMRQFIRFEHMEHDVWFARCNPNARVIPFVMPWFTARFNTQRFIIFDEAHLVSGIYDGHTCHLVQGNAVPPKPTEDNGTMKQAWKRYFDSLCVTERINPELQRQFMPKRLWKNITEMQPELDAKRAG